MTTSLHKAIDDAIDSEGTIIGDFWGLLTILGIEKPLKILNQKGEYHDRFRKSMEDHYPIQLDIAVRSRLREFPIEVLSEFIKHLKLILEDTERIRDSLINDYGIREGATEAYGFASCMKPTIHQKLDNLLADPIEFFGQFKEGGLKWKELENLNFKGRSSLRKAIKQAEQEVFTGK